MMKLASVGLLVSCAALADSGSVAPRAANVDNTRVNHPSELTAQDQQNNRSDVEITRMIRRSVMKDAALSTYAHNVKIVTRDGEVTLKGPVHSMAEKNNIENKAQSVNGVKTVRNELEVKSDQG